ncbi:Uroporphyrinogen decarboxylase [Planctopirus ephydatiae]|uniref:Uroporphyrinogen decarboxylase n=1 Tax=Planctopirus ephydatiae TaxID=2528019 RepID=A0A518GRA4_9PLAN|nr:uroporphyrinogen decarboxylase [Planctopirus ephydatiae]QDV31127.1 Uroporphyrinogen decarboxylase [Planctopirus ephydatiae]
MMTTELADSRFMRAVRREATDTTPIWIMRQAGRYLPEYMAVRSKVTFLELCETPALAAEVTLTAREVLDVDAAILFADLLPMLRPMGIDLEYAKGEGPVIHNPLRAPDDLQRFRELEDLSSLGFVYDAIRLIRKDLPGNIPLLGFAGAPFTLASYVLEGGGSRNYLHTKRWMYNHPEEWHELMGRLSRTIVRYLLAQAAAGCQAVQIFDSWAGCLSPGDYREFVLPHTKAVIQELMPHVAVINFMTGNPALLAMQNEAGGSLLGIDWRHDIGDVWKLVGDSKGIQGNLDPLVLEADLPILKAKADAILEASRGHRGHVFNLGHGVYPEVDPEKVKELVRHVHESGAR